MRILFSLRKYQTAVTPSSTFLNFTVADIVGIGALKATWSATLLHGQEQTAVAAIAALLCSGRDRIDTRVQRKKRELLQWNHVEQIHKAGKHALSSVLERALRYSPLARAWHLLAKCTFGMCKPLAELLATVTATVGHSTDRLDLQN